MIVNVDGYISEIPDGATTLEFRSGDSGTDRFPSTAGCLIVRDVAGNEMRTRSLAAEFNLPQRPWWERLWEATA